MENELNRLIEQQNQEYEKQFLDDDDARSNADIDDFEQKIKFNKSMMGFNNDDSDDDTIPSKPNKKKNTFQPPKQTKSLLKDEPDLLKQVQEMHKNKNKEIAKSTKMTDLQNEITKHKHDAKPKTEDDKLIDILNSNNTTLKDKKLKELIQKNKELYVSLEKEKTLRQKLQRDLDKVKEDTDMALAAMEGRVPKGASKQDDTAEWKKKYTEIEKRFQESKLQNTTLKNDLNKAMRIISKEIGENINIDSILTQENSWKGRAQQIEVLKARVKELQAKVSSTKDFADVSSIIDKSQSDLGMMTSDNRSVARSSSIGGKLPSKERREEMESLKVQADALKAENDSLNEKVKALSSRKTILEKEIKELRNESDRSKAVLMEKSSNDDKYISALKRELEKMKSQSPALQTRIVYRDKPIEAKRYESEDVDDSMAKKELSILKNELEKKEKIIKELINEKVRNVNTNLNKENVIHENITDQEKVIKLETMIKILRQENEELSNLKLGVKSSTTPDSKIIKDLSLQNAQLRRKLDDLQQKLKPPQ